MSLGGDKKTTTTRQTNEPWSAAQPYLKENLEAVSNLPSMEAFDQSLSVPFSDQSLQGLQGMETAANAASGATAQPLQGFSDMFGQLLGEAQGGDSAMMQRAMERARESADLSFSGMGRYGGGAHSEALGRGLMDAQLDQINNSRSQLMNYGQAIPGAYQASLAPSQTMLDVGGLREAQTANELNDQARRFYEGQETPFTDLAQRNALYTGAGALGGTTRGTATVPGTNWGQTAAGYGAQALGASMGGK